MAQLLRALTVLLENPGLIPRTYLAVTSEAQPPDMPLVQRCTWSQNTRKNKILFLKVKQCLKTFWKLIKIKPQYTQTSEIQWKGSEERNV